ncbi:tetratricopeptide repeat protein [Aliiroseovarius sp. KMU-71]|uniref:tetratricopeptide repeat protein n=1 Tax=Aliiroseovarius sp. KMU-71 TaxID=3453123 RepID=UPI003F46B3F4
MMEREKIVSLHREAEQLKRRLRQLRNAHVVPAMKAKDLDFAKRINDTLLDLMPSSVTHRRDQAVIGRSRKDTAAVISAAHVLTRELPFDAIAAATALQSLLQVGENVHAAEIAMHLLPDWNKDVLVLRLSATALYRARRFTHALEAARCLLSGKSIGDPADARIAITILCQQGRFHEALAAMENLPPEILQDPTLRFDKARALEAITPGSPEATRIVREDLSAQPDNPRLMGVLFRLLVDQGNSAEAISLVQNLPARSRPSSLSSQLARELIAVGESAKALTILEELVAENPDNKHVRKSCTEALVASGEIERARAMYAVGVEQRAAGLSGDFASQMAAISKGTSDPALVPEQRLDWFCEKLAEARVNAGEDAPRGDEQRLRAEILHASKVDRLFLDWLECRPDQITQVYDFINIAASAKELLRGALADQRGAIIATAHVGVLFSGPPALEKAGFRAKWVASLPDLGDPRLSEYLISVSTSQALSVARRVTSALKENIIVAVAIDGSLARHEEPSIELFGAPVRLSNFLPRTSYRTGAPSFFPRLVLQEGIVDIDLIALPVPSPGESRPAFTTRWFEAFETELTCLLTTNPYAMRGAGGLWTRLAT